MYERNNSFRKFKEIRMYNVNLNQQEFANNAKVKKQVKVTYMVQEWHEAIIAIDESLDDDELNEAVGRYIDEINWECPDNEETYDEIDEYSIDIEEYGDPANIRLNDRYYLLKKVDGEYVGGIAISDEV
jgi:hypothetical protein